MRILIYGSNGWIGKQFIDALSMEDQSIIILKGLARVDNEKDVEEEIIKLHSDRIICLIGRTHGEINIINSVDLINILIKYIN